jgi:EAL domain-containing protein (putative c-di-GMP-specific phosphodiesterase class I)
MSSKFRVLIVSDDQSFCEELTQRAVDLNFSVRSIRTPEELPRVLQTHGLDWLFLDASVGRLACLDIIDMLGGVGASLRILSIADNSEVFRAIRRRAAENGLKLVGNLTRPVRSKALKALVESALVEEAPRTLDTIFRQVDVIPSDEIVIHYQPIVSMSDRTVCGMEALVRWQHPQFGLLMPARFIGLAESSGAITALTWEVLRAAIDEHTRWKQAGLPFAVSVNASALFLDSLEIAEGILGLLSRSACDPRSLMLEVTETEVAKEPATTRALLTHLGDAGVQIAMDDYGVGYSTIERLNYYPFSALKVDRMLVAQLGASQEAYQTLKDLVSSAQRKQVRLIGEGIETQEQWDILQELGYHCGQGFFIARPMAADEIGTWMKVTQEGKHR